MSVKKQKRFYDPAEKEAAINAERKIGEAAIIKNVCYITNIYQASKHNPSNILELSKSYIGNIDPKLTKLPSFTKFENELKYNGGFEIIEIPNPLMIADYDGIIDWCHLVREMNPVFVINRALFGSDIRKDSDDDITAIQIVQRHVLSELEMFLKDIIEIRYKKANGIVDSRKYVKKDFLKRTKEEIDEIENAFSTSILWVEY